MLEQDILIEVTSLDKFTQSTENLNKEIILHLKHNLRNLILDITSNDMTVPQLKKELIKQFNCLKPLLYKSEFIDDISTIEIIIHILKKESLDNILTQITLVKFLVRLLDSVDDYTLYRLMCFMKKTEGLVSYNNIIEVSLKEIADKILVYRGISVKNTLILNIDNLENLNFMQINNIYNELKVTGKWYTLPEELKIMLEEIHSDKFKNYL